MKKTNKVFLFIEGECFTELLAKFDIFKVDVNDLNIENRCLHFHSTLHKIWDPGINLIGKMFR